MRGSTAVLAVVAAVVVGCGREAPLVTRATGASRSVVVRNVHVFDAAAGQRRDALQAVVVRDGRIAAVGATDVPAPGLAEVDGGGGTLLPGLVDVHTHPGGSSKPPWGVALPDVADNLGAYLYAGVTTILDLGGLTPEAFRERDRVARGEHLGPRLYVAGPIFTAPGGHPAEVLRTWLPWYLRWYVVPRVTREVATPDAARAAVAALLAERPDILKLAIDGGARDDVPDLAPETIAAVTAAGHAAGVRSIAHIGSSAEAIAAVRGGVDALAHAPWREEVSDDAAAAIAAAHVPVVVTLAIWDVGGSPRTRVSDLLPIEREVAPADVLAALVAPPPALDDGTQAFMRAASAAHAARYRNVGKLRAAGVTILAGSDACNPNQFPGAGLHLELGKLVEAGLTPGEALRAATWQNARFLAGDGADFGEVAVGKRGDLVVVAGDPTAHIEALGAITQVVLDGTVLARHARR